MATGMALHIVEGTQAGRRLDLQGSDEIGRDPGTSLTLDDQQVSRRHALVRVSGGEVVIEDLGSRNGTFVNDRPIHGAVRISSGDEVRLGTTVMELRGADRAGEPAPVARPAPPVSQVGEVLRPAAEGELAPIPSLAETPPLRDEEKPAAYVSPEALEARGKGGNPDVLARLVDTRVKRQTNVAAFAILAAAGLAVLIFFGAR